MAMIIDASVTTPWFVDHPLTRATAKFQHEEIIILPSICIVETANAVWKYVKLGAASLSNMQDAIRSLQEMAFEIVADCDLLENACLIAAENKHPVYDCLYLALARERNFPLITADKRLAALATKISIKTQLIRPAP